MKKLISFALVVFFLGCSTPRSNELQDLIDHSEAQFEYALKQIKPLVSDKRVEPRTFENGEVKMVNSPDWTSGFFPGNLWMMYELSGNEKWKDKALEYTLPLEPEQWNGSNHDVGFKMYCSFGNAYKYTQEPAFRDILIQSAKTLSTRYNPVVGCIRSWDSNKKTSHWKYPVIIDNMMNLELLMWAAKETGNDNFREIAVKHALTTMHNHFRDDYSSYHVVDYDPETGKAIAHNTHQGYADESSWSRGQAWALYGYTMMYRETGMPEFLSQAENVADYLLTEEGIKDGEIPRWDFDAPNQSAEPYDASAAAVISAALFELAGFSNNSEEYFTVAEKLLKTLSSSEFLAPVGENGGFLLTHSTGSKPFNSEIDVPLVYADYYFLEALIHYRKMSKN